MNADTLSSPEPKPIPIRYMVFALVCVLVALAVLFVFRRNHQMIANLTDADRAHIAQIRDELRTASSPGSVLLWHDGHVTPLAHRCSKCLSTYYSFGEHRYIVETNDLLLNDIDRVVRPDDHDYGKVVAVFIRSF